MKVVYYEKNAKVDDIVAKYYDVERFVKLCEKCPNYDKNHSCPSYRFDTISYLKKYKNLKFVLAKVYLDDSERKIDVYSDLIELARDDLKKYLDKFENNKINSVLLNAGPCKICKECTRKIGKSCKYPTKLRYSIESLGGNVDAILKDFFDEQILWVQDKVVPEYFLFLGGLLYN